MTVLVSPCPDAVLRLPDPARAGHSAWMMFHSVVPTGSGSPSHVLAAGEHLDFHDRVDNASVSTGAPGIFRKISGGQQ